MPAPARSTVTSTVTSDNRPAAPALSRRIFLSKMVRRETIIGWLFVLPALLMYAAFVLLPLLLSIQYSFFRWDGIGPMTWVGLKNYADRPPGSRSARDHLQCVPAGRVVQLHSGGARARRRERDPPRGDRAARGSQPGPFCSCPRSSRSLRPGSSGAGCWPSRA